MANAKQSESTTQKLSKRKAQSTRKTQRIKTKVTKPEGVDFERPGMVEEDSQQRERVVTSRHRRVAEKAHQRQVTGGGAADETTVQAVRITDVAGVVYDPEEYQQMVDMYDGTIKSIKEGEVVAGRVIGKIGRASCRERV